MASNRFTRSPSEASRYRIRYGMPRSRRCSRPVDSSPKNTPPRTSTTMATRLGPPRPEASSAIFSISAGGRLSTTKYPRSSRHLAASERPAPDSPVMMVKSGPPVSFTGRAAGSDAPVGPARSAASRSCCIFLAVRAITRSPRPEARLCPPRWGIRREGARGSCGPSRARSPGSAGSRPRWPGGGVPATRTAGAGRACA